MTNAMQKNNAEQGYRLDTAFDQIFNHSLRRFFDGNLWDRDNDRTAGSVPINVKENEL